MALGDPYATLVQLKVYLGNISDTVDDQVLTDALNAVSRSIERHCGRQFNDAGSASARLFTIGDPCVVTIDDFSTTTGLVIATDDSNSGTYSTTWSATDYQLEPLNGIVNGESGWPYYRIRVVLGRYFPTAVRRAALQVTARWGWTAVPAPVKQACLLLASETAKLRDAPFGVAGFGQFGAVRVRDNPKAASLLAPYRRYPVLVG